MKLKLKPHIKLLETVAMLLALFAWAMEWSSIQKWASASSDLRASIESLQDAHSATHLSAVIQLESAVTRATRDRDFQAETLLSDYALAWESSDVRNKWLRRTENTIRLLSNLIAVLRSTQKENNLDSSQSLNEISSELDALASDISARLFVHTKTLNMPIPDVNLMRGRDAGAIDQQLAQIHNRLATPINETVSALKANADSRSLVYRLIFIVGAVLLVLAKGVEWWLDLKSEKTISPPENSASGSAA